MKLRPYITGTDFEEIKSWIEDERTHAMWCAGRFCYPLAKDNFEETLASMTDDTPFVAVNEDGDAIGFFCFAYNGDTKEGMLKFIVLNPEFRGKGFAGQMLNSAKDYAFNDVGAEAVHLNVFTENIRARKCYEKAGFVERNLTENAFSYKDESWGRCNMICRKENC